MEHWEIIEQLQVVWDDEFFPLGTDTLLLSRFPKLRKNLRVCDLCCGSGLPGLLLLARENTLQVCGLELQEEAVSLARRAAEVNHFTREQFRIQAGDVREYREFYSAGSFDLVTVNPPYFPPGSGKISPLARRRQSRTESTCTLEEICEAAAYLLRWGGAFCLVHKPERLSDIIYLFREYHMEAKRLQLVSPKPDAPPSLILLEGRRGGKPGLRIETYRLETTATNVKKGQGHGALPQTPQAL